MIEQIIFGFPYLPCIEIIRSQEDHFNFNPVTF